MRKVLFFILFIALPVFCYPAEQGTNSTAASGGRHPGDAGKNSPVIKNDGTNKTSPKNNDKMASLLDDRQKKTLLKIARDTLTLYVTEKKVLAVEETDPVLTQNMGAFVTLNEKGRLRGCIGSMTARAPLYLTIRDMAISAASTDPRFPPVRKEELPDIKIEISVLSPLRKIASADEIILGIHGVIVSNMFTSGVYLPQVATETGWSKEQFMNSLCVEKAGMNADAWKTGQCDIHVFTADVFDE